MDFLEHRNMPLDDALMMLARNFKTYLSSLRSGSEQPSMGFLLNLLADGKHLSVAELDRIIAHLQDRRDRMIEAEGGKVIARGKQAWEFGIVLVYKMLSFRNCTGTSKSSGTDPAANYEHFGHRRERGWRSFAIVCTNQYSSIRIDCATARPEFESVSIDWQCSSYGSACSRKG